MSKVHRTIRMDERLSNWLDAVSEKEGRSFSNFVERNLSKLQFDYEQAHGPVKITKKKTLKIR